VDQQVINFKKKLSDENKHGLVLDIDETLSWTIGYWVQQLRQKFGNPENLSVEELVAKYTYTQKVPYWQTPAALEWMENARENNQIQEQMLLISNADHFVNKINSIVPIVGYLTTRPRTILSGTQQWLIKYNFPKVEILARPADISSATGDVWKAAVLDFLYPQVEGIIDDKSFVAESLSQNYKGTFYLYNSEKTKLNHIKIIPCKTWSDVYAQIKLVYGPKKIKSIK